MNLSGPQTDRDLFWRKGQHNRATDSANDEVFDSEVNKLRSENIALRDQLQRSLKELKLYQSKYPSPYTSRTGIDSREDDDTPKLSASPEITSALFEAYDTRIYELEDTIKHLNSKLTTFRENAEILINENEELRSAHLDGFKSAAPGSIRLDPSAPLNAEIIADLQEQVDVLRGENNLLMEQRGVLMSELEGHQAELERKAAEVAQLKQQLFAAVNDVQSLSKRAEQAEKDRDAAASQALSYGDVLGKAEVGQEALTERVSALQLKCKESERAIEEYKKQLRSLSMKSEDDSSATLKRVQDAENRVRELHGALHAKTQELDASAELVRKLRTEYQTTRQDAEGMLQVMGGLERQLSEYAAREADVNKRDKSCKEQEEEMAIFKEQCNARDDQNKREIERLIAERKLISLRRKDEIERAMEQTRKNMSEQIAALEKEVDVLAEKNAKLIFEAEKAGRDGRSAEEFYRRVQRLHEEESKSVQGSLRDLSERLDAVTKQKELEATKRADAQEQAKELRIAAEKLRVTIDDLRAHISQLERSHEASSAALKASVRDLQKDVAEKSRLLSKKTKDLEDIRASLTEQTASLERKHLEEAALLQRRATEAERSVRDFEAAGFAADMRTQTSIDQLKEKYAAAVSLLDARLRSESENAKGLAMKIRNSESMIADLLEEKAALSRLAEDAQQEVKHQDAQLSSCRATISDLTAQLASSHQAREDGAFRAARTIEDMQVSSPLRRSFGEFKTSESILPAGGAFVGESYY